MNIEPLRDKIPARIFEELPAVMRRFEINTIARLAHFLSQCDHESGGFKTFVENLNYSESQLLKVFPKYFTKDEAKLYARNPEAIANRVYGGRMGNNQSGDGYRFCGRGCIQLTGRDNYTLFDKFVTESLLEMPRLVATKYPLFSAGWFWQTRLINQLCTNDPASVVAVTKRVNGGVNGLSHRQERFGFYLDLLTIV
jgi:putative chitinase